MSIVIIMAITMQSFTHLMFTIDNDDNDEDDDDCYNCTDDTDNDGRNTTYLLYDHLFTR